MRCTCRRLALCEKFVEYGQRFGRFIHLPAIYSYIHALTYSKRPPVGWPARCIYFFLFFKGASRARLCARPCDNCQQFDSFAVRVNFRCGAAAIVCEKALPTFQRRTLNMLNF